MKLFLELSNDCIIKYKFTENRINNIPEWVDGKTKKAKGKHYVDSISMLVKNYDGNGYTGKLDELWISKDDILKLADKIKSIESEVNVIGIPDQDLPF